MENTHIQARTHTHTRELSGNRPAAMAHRVALRCQGPAACQRCRSLQPAQRQEVCRLSGEKTTRLLVKNFNALFNPRLSLCHPLARRDSAIGHACDLHWCWWAALGPGGGVGIKAKRFFFSLSLPKCGGNEKHRLFLVCRKGFKVCTSHGGERGAGKLQFIRNHPFLCSSSCCSSSKCGASVYRKLDNVYQSNWHEAQ